MIECQNAFALIQCCTLCVGQNIRDYKWYKVQTHVLKVCSVHSIHSLWKSKRMATYMQRMHNNNLEIRIVGSSWRLWLSFIQRSTCQNNIIANSFWVKLINAWDFRPVMTGVSENVPATSAHFKQFSEVWICLSGARNCPCQWVKSRSKNKSPGMKLMDNVLELAGIL